MSEEIKSVIDNLNSTFEDFKSENSKRLDEVEKKGSASAELESKVDAMAEDITKMAEQKQQIELTKKALEEAEVKLDKLETVLARPETGLNSKDVNLQMKAFGKMLRKGKDNIDPMELKALYESDDTLGGYYVRLLELELHQTEGLRFLKELVSLLLHLLMKQQQEQRQLDIKLA